jgi:hypothetical protein
MVGRVNVRISGLMGTTVPEVWSVGFNYAAPAGAGQGDQAVVTDLADAYAAYLSGSAEVPAAVQEMSSNCSITQVDVYGYNQAGPAAAGATAFLTTPRQGGGSISKTFQTARVITLQTALPGARNRGRIYVPALSATVTSAGTSGPPTGYMTAWVNVLTEPESLWAGSAPIDLGVYSAVADTVTPVTRIRAGNVLDVQRRRVDGLVETFTSLNL